MIILFLGVLMLYDLLFKDFILEAILNENLVFWISGEALWHLEDTFLTIKLYLDEYGNMIGLEVGIGKIECNLSFLWCASKPEQGLVGTCYVWCFKFLWLDIEASVKNSLTIQYVAFSILVCIVQDETEGSWKCSVKLDLSYILISTRSVHVAIDKWFHWV